MTTNNDVVRAFEQGLQAKTTNLRSTGTELISYNTIVALRINNNIIKTSNYYSTTTSKQLSYLKKDIILPFNIKSDYLDIKEELITQLIRYWNNTQFNLKYKYDRTVLIDVYINTEKAITLLGQDFKVLKTYLDINKELYNLALNKETELKEKRELKQLAQAV